MPVLPRIDNLLFGDTMSFLKVINIATNCILVKMHVYAITHFFSPGS